jgi:xanthine dehydrogenase YagS FAD-binding subunit
MLSALDARVTVRHAAGKDAGAPLPLHKLYEKAWSDPLAHHSLPPSSYLARVSIPATRNRSVYRQMSEKSEFDWALVSCGVAGQVRDGKIYDARIALGAVAPVPYLVEAAHDYLEGKELTDAAAAHAADLVLQDAKPLSQNGYKLPLARTLIRRTLLALNT